MSRREQPAWAPWRDPTIPAKPSQPSESQLRRKCFSRSVRKVKESFGRFNRRCVAWLGIAKGRGDHVNARNV
ncbi:hypothetical protein H9L39_07491 [Fusarium oxysporum f. sp. albedinis]|nr:hypothetical protein H9L39_07491 [Fusarium oxysporum f. sp. albedinis]